MTNSYPIIQLKKGKEISIYRKHHWVFSGAISRMDEPVHSGDLVEVHDYKGHLIGIGFYGEGSIAVRIISFEPAVIDKKFWQGKLESALKLRIRLGLLENDQTNVFRLFHGEGDHIPGLIIDFYNGTAVIQAHHNGIHNQLPYIAEALSDLLGSRLAAVYDKSKATIGKGIEVTDGLIKGIPSTQLVEEYGNKFEIDWETGQKTGFFIDQRENRKLLAQYAKGKKVLNTFCYTGGFSVYALNAGAKEVHSVDISAAAIAMTERNALLNGHESPKHQAVGADVLHYLKDLPDSFDIIVLDPPAFAKNIRSRHQAVQAYKRINALALKNIRPGGLLFTFSCSQVVDTPLFANTVTAAAMEAGRPAKILHWLGQAPDHPVNIFHQETSYLKGLVLYVH